MSPATQWIGAVDKVTAIVLIDTSVLLNVLGVPSKSGARAAVMAQLREHILANDQLLLPMATILETGNHIGQIKQNGAERRRCAMELVKVVGDAVTNHVPWYSYRYRIRISSRLGSTVSPPEATGGVGLGDVSIIDAWHRAVSASRVGA